MTSADTHREQHFVPKFILKQWLGPDKKLGVYKRTAAGRLLYNRLSHKSVAKVRDLYSLRRSTRNPDVSIEKTILGPLLDEPASLVHAKLLSSQPDSLTGSQREAWARLLFAALVRVPGMVSHFRELGNQKLLAQESHVTHSADALEDEGMQLFLNAIGSSKYSQRLLGAHWRVVDVPQECEDALICDSPVVYLGDFWNDKFAMVTPISPRRFFVCADHSVYMSKLDSMNSAALLEATNKRLVQHADRYVYTTNQSHEQTVDEWLGRRSGLPV